MTNLAAGLRLPGPLEWIANRVTHMDVHRAERLEFLESTHALRELLFARSQERNSTRAETQLAAALKRIWSKQGVEFVAEQQRRTFALWDECAEDEVGRVQCERIEAFVRERCPQGSECEFGPGSLAALNRGRRSHLTFAPYRALPF